MQLEAMMKIALSALLLLLPSPGLAQVVSPEVVRLDNVRTEDDMMTVSVGNANKHWTLMCNTKAEGCVKPEADQDYYLIDKRTRFVMPGAKTYLTLQFVQEWTSSYSKGENIGLVPAPANKEGKLSIFVLDPDNGGYETDTVFVDGPIIYGTGMSDVDRQAAWKHFFLQMVAAVAQQQGQDALKVKLAKRCMPGNDFCTMTLDANFVGIGGIQEPRKVIVMVATDVKDPNQQVARIVCTRPAKAKQVCRDWNTGKLMADN